MRTLAFLAFRRGRGILVGMMSYESARMNPLLKKLLLLNVVIFGLQLVTRVVGWPFVDHYFAVSGEGVASGQVWELFTYMWLHGSVWHLLFNMIGLYFFGRVVLELLGPKHFLQLYVLGGLVGAVLWVIFNWSSAVPMMGASGAVLALVIAFATLEPKSEIFLFPIPFPIQAKWVALGYAGISVAQLLSNPGSSIAHLAHLGGMAAGFVYVLVWQGRLPRLMPEWSKPKVSVYRPPASASAGRPAVKDKGAGLGDDFIAREVDPILEKIAREGVGSLTAREQKILEEARKRL